MNLFLPDSGLVVWMLIAFSLVFFVLAKFAWPSILSSIKEREEHIAESLKKADEATQTLAGLELKGKEIIAQAQAQQMNLVKDTKALTDKMIADAKLEAKKQAELIISDAQAKIQKDKENAIQEIRNEVAQLSISIAEKVLKKELSDKKAQNAYIETLLKENKSLS